jgi:hypothetical protein
MSLLLAALLPGFPSIAGAATPWWKNVGPEGGAIRGLVLDPAAPGTLYAGTSVGVFKTVNEGASWTATNNGLTSPSILGLA